MFKVTLELFKVNFSCRASFGLVVLDDKSMTQQKTDQLIKFTKFNGNDYMRISPYPFITIDISKQKEEWTKNQSFTLNKKDLFLFLRYLEKFYTSLTTKDLFFYDNKGKLQTNLTLANSLQVSFILNNKVISFYPSLVPNEEKPNECFEGMILYVNSVENFTYLTHEEASYFLYELRKINLSQLSLEVINILYKANVLQGNNFTNTENQIAPQFRQIEKPLYTERKPVEIQDIKPLYINKPVIPNI